MNLKKNLLIGFGFYRKSHLWFLFFHVTTNFSTYFGKGLSIINLYLTIKNIVPNLNFPPKILPQVFTIYFPYLYHNTQIHKICL
jgi:hypothetical protein